MRAMLKIRPKWENDVAKCKRNGWTVGTRLIGDEGYGPTVIELTAIGREQILAIEISHKGKLSEDARESNWTLTERDWQKVEEA